MKKINGYTEIPASLLRILEHIVRPCHHVLTYTHKKNCILLRMKPKFSLTQETKNLDPTPGGARLAPCPRIDSTESGPSVSCFTDMTLGQRFE